MVYSGHEFDVDSALLVDSGATLKEIPGGCMCCVNGLPLQIGLNTLLTRNRPDRLRNEPTGMVHPGQILALLFSDIYQNRLTLLATLCLLDALQLSQTRYRDNVNFLDQLAAADIIIANKQETYTGATKSRWRRTLNQGQSYYVCSWIFNSETQFATLGLLE